MSCRICETRRARRFCPGLGGDICSVCCGTEREATVRCPLDCPYLQEARQHQRIEPADPDKFPNRDIQVTESFLRSNEDLVVFAGRTLLGAALETQGAVDTDIREALDAMIRTYRTAQSGLIYQTRPANPIAGAIQQLFQAAADAFRNQARERGRSVRDAELLGVLAFLQRLELDHNNGRRLGRAFQSFLLAHFPAEQANARPSGLILP